MANGRALLTATPPLTPPSFGLLSVATEITDPPRNWQAGVTWEPVCAAAGVTYDECLVVLPTGLPPAEPPTKTATYEDELRAATPFTVLVRKDCSPVGWWSDADAESAAALTASEGWQVERTFWTGLAAGQEVAWPHLASDTDVVDGDDGAYLGLAADVVTAGPVPLIDAVGLLEAALGDCYHGAGVLHLPAQLGVHAADKDVIARTGARYLTPSGNLVAIGRGYPGTGPTGAAPLAGSTWIYATGAVWYIRSPIRDFANVDGFDRSVNTLEKLAERSYVLGWDCCLFAAQVDTSSPEGDEGA